METINITLDFKHIKEIGQEGRNSRVFLSHDNQLDGDIVTKHIIKHPEGNPEVYFREARILYANDHNNIVRVNYAGQNDEEIVIAMPYYKNGSLKSRISEGHYLTIREIVRYAIQFLMGLNHIHAKGLVHFDIKPDNILISDANEAMLSDFGLAKYIEMDGFVYADKCYTPHITPEQLLKKSQTRLNDIYQVGITLYRMVNGNDSFYNQIPLKEHICQKILSGEFPNRKIYLPHVPRKLRLIINKCMEVNPINRYDNVLQIINELSKISQNLDWRYSKGEYDCWELQRENDSIKVYLLINKDEKFDIEVVKLKNVKETKEKRNSCSNFNLKDVDKKLNDIFAKYE